MRITIGGCRDFTDYDFFARCVQNYLKEINNSEEIVILSGHCSGVDEMAEKICKRKWIFIGNSPCRMEKVRKGSRSETKQRNGRKK